MPRRGLLRALRLRPGAAALLLLLALLPAWGRKAATRRGVPAGQRAEQLGVLAGEWGRQRCCAVDARTMHNVMHMHTAVRLLMR